MKRQLIIITGIAVALLSLYFDSLTANAQSMSKNEEMARTEQFIQKQFNAFTSAENVHNAFFQLHSDSFNLDQSLVYGQDHEGVGLSKEVPFYVASIGKTFTATIIMQLIEEGLLESDELLVNLLPEKTTSGLHVLNGVDFTDVITVHQLLNHTSGLPDYFEDMPIKGANMMALLFESPNRFWEPEELIEFTKQNFKPHFAPGKRYHYSDTEYILIGLIIEQLTRQALHDTFTERIFKPLNMRRTAMNLRSQPLDRTTPVFAPMYAGGHEISKLTSLSADWAGGGITSTTSELITFHKALVAGKLISKEAYTQMQNWIHESQGTYYGYGLRKWEFQELSDQLPPITLVGHSGSTGSYMYYAPELGTYFAGTFNQTEQIDSHIHFLIKVITELSTIKNSNP
ncbi:MAG: serine hydrolase domain-containing protein [Bacteroidota bacterium]